MKRLIVLLLISVASINMATGQNKDLGKISPKERDKILMDIANKVVRKYGPDYYIKNTVPEIERWTVPENNESLSAWRRPGRVSYSIKYYWPDVDREKRPRDFRAHVEVWEDTGVAYMVSFGRTTDSDVFMVKLSSDLLADSEENKDHPIYIVKTKDDPKGCMTQKEYKEYKKRKRQGK